MCFFNKTICLKACFSCFFVFLKTFFKQKHQTHFPSSAQGIRIFQVLPGELGVYKFRPGKSHCLTFAPGCKTKSESTKSDMWIQKQNPEQKPKADCNTKTENTLLKLAFYRCERHRAICLTRKSSFELGITPCTRTLNSRNFGLIYGLVW